MRDGSRGRAKESEVSEEEKQDYGGGNGRKPERLITAGTTGGLHGFLMSLLGGREILKHPPKQTLSALSLKGGQRAVVKSVDRMHRPESQRFVTSAGYLTSHFPQSCFPLLSLLIS